MTSPHAPTHWRRTSTATVAVLLLVSANATATASAAGRAEVPCPERARTKAGRREGEDQEAPLPHRQGRVGALEGFDEGSRPQAVPEGGREAQEQRQGQSEGRQGPISSGWLGEPSGARDRHRLRTRQTAERKRHVRSQVSLDASRKRVRAASSPTIGGRAAQDDASAHPHGFGWRRLLWTAGTGVWVCTTIRLS